MMDRAQFMQELEKLLADISETERQDALDFYNSYFDDAGAENEASVLRELGSPEKVAAIIKADLKGSAGGYEYGEYTEHGYEDARTKERGQMPEKYGEESGTGKRFFRKGNQAVLILAVILLRRTVPVKDRQTTVRQPDRTFDDRCRPCPSPRRC